MLSRPQDFTRPFFPTVFFRVTHDRLSERGTTRSLVFLTNKLIGLCQRLVDGDNSATDLIQDVECRLKAIYTKGIEGIFIRSRAEWLEEGERPTGYFFKLQTARAQKSQISSIYDSSVVEVSSQEEIERAHFDLYSSLFSEEPVDLNF